MRITGYMRGADRRWRWMMKRLIFGIVLSGLLCGSVAHADCTLGQVEYQRVSQGPDRALRVTLRQTIFGVGAVTDAEPVVKLKLGFVGSANTVTRKFKMVRSVGPVWENRVTRNHRVRLIDNGDDTATVRARFRFPYITFNGSYGVYATLESSSCQ